jgi:hypothetical protein
MTRRDTKRFAGAWRAMVPQILQIALNLWLLKQSLVANLSQRLMILQLNVSINFIEAALRLPAASEHMSAACPPPPPHNSLLLLLLRSSSSDCCTPAAAAALLTLAAAALLTLAPAAAAAAAAHPPLLLLLLLLILPCCCCTLSFCSCSTSNVIIGTDLLYEIRGPPSTETRQGVLQI